jgi:hypothetical protein
MEELPKKIEDKLNKNGPGGCWLWTGDLRDGYGQVWFEGKHRIVHRVVYEYLVGPIPAGLQTDHLCRVRACSNPAHLELVTNKVNAQRGNVGGWQRRLTHCKNGHPLSGNNIRMQGKRRICRACQREWAARKAKQKGNKQ